MTALSSINIEELIPHRSRMKLIDEVIEVDGEMAVTESVVRGDWPLCQEDSVNTFILIELVAQTAGVYIGWKESVINGKNIEGSKGWLVGIKEGLFYSDKIPLGSRIRVRSKKVFNFQNYHEILGVAEMGPQVIGEIKLQVIHSESDPEP